MTAERGPVVIAERSRRSFKAPQAAVLGYSVVMLVLIIVVYNSAADVLSRFTRVAELTDLAAQLDRRRPPGRLIDADVPAGAPFLEGATQAIAGAALLQRVAAAVTRAGGSVQSSQVELQGAKSGEGYTTLTASCEIPEPMLQAFLYDIESGMPFLFVDNLVVQIPQGTGGAENAPLRVLIEVSGQWRDGR